MRFRWSRWRPRFATQALLAQVAVLVLVVGSGFLLIALLLRAELQQRYEQRALTIAHAVAADERIASFVAHRQLAAEVQRRAEAVRARTGALFVSVSDDRGVRYAHVDPSHVGQPGSVTPQVLSDGEVLSIEHGTLGTSARARVPIRSTDGAVVGEVFVGVSADAIYHRLVDLLQAAAGFAAGTLLLGVAGAAVLTRQLKRQTLHLEPRELGDLLREREAVLYGIGEGVLAIDPADRITVCNDAAARLLARVLVPGTPLREAKLPPGLRPLLENRSAVRGVVITTEDRTLILSAAPVRRAHHDLGHVVTMRDHTELDQMARELDVVRALSDALRAQAHEYTNRLHTLYGLVRFGHVGEAEAYLRELIDDPLATEHGDAGRLRDPYIRGLLAAKNAAAAEQSVQLRLTDESYLPGRLTEPLDVVTVLGNLIDNAVVAAAKGQRRPAWVEVSLVAEGDTLAVTVVDSGDGVPEGMEVTLFEPGVTTKTDAARPHGIGLALARQLARRHGGQLELARGSGAECGAVFVARLPGVLEAASEWPGMSQPAPAEATEPVGREAR